MGKGKSALGKGLDALLPQKKGNEILDIELERIVTGSEQPRKMFADDPLRELAASIKERGVLQPVIVKRHGSGTFMLIAGERRFRASKLAGMKSVPAIVREAGAEDALEIALIENIQRENLNPVETAMGFERLMKQFGLTQEALADKVGKERATVANFLRLLALPQTVKDLIAGGTLTMGHAKAILTLDDPAAQLKAAMEIVEGGLTVREAEAHTRTAARKKQKADAPKPLADPDTRALEDKLIRALGTKVKLKHKGGKGSITIEYYSLEELDRLLDLLMP
jgi:ParB family chromosome partitioning protein